MMITPLVLLEAVHLHEELVQRLLALVVSAAEARAAVAADGVDLVDEDDAGRAFLGLFEQVAHAAGADADEHLDEFRAARCEKNGTPASPATALASRVLPVPGGPEQQHAARDLAAEPLELRGFLQELDDFLQLGLGLVGPGHVRRR